MLGRVLTSSVTIVALAGLLFWAGLIVDADASNHTAHAHHHTAHAHHMRHKVGDSASKRSVSIHERTNAPNGSSHHHAGHPKGCFGHGGRSHDQQHECCGDSAFVPTMAASRLDREGRLLAVMSNHSTARIRTILLNFQPTGPPQSVCCPYFGWYQQSWRSILHGDAPRLRI